MSSEYDPSAYDEQIQTAVEKLMAPGAKCDPLEPSNFDEALSETMAGVGGSKLIYPIAVALRKGEPVNKMLTDLTEAYWYSQAVDCAKDDLEEARERAAEDRAEDRRDQEREDRAYWLTH